MSPSGATISVPTTGGCARLRPPADRRIATGGLPPIAAFTATATPEVRDDIVTLLGLEQPQVLVAGFDRPNIDLRVERVDGSDDKDERLPGWCVAAARLVYAATRKTAEAAAGLLQAGGLGAAAYHAGLADAERMRSRTRLPPDPCPSSAPQRVRHGIDRPDVDAVVHYAIPDRWRPTTRRSVAHGRDGRPATATLLWDYDDVLTRRFLIDRPRRDPPGRRAAVLDPAEAARRKALEHLKLRRMVDYADTRACLRATILRYFGDAAVREPCDSCGNCRRGGMRARQSPAAGCVTGLSSSRS